MPRSNRRTASRAASEAARRAGPHADPRIDAYIAGAAPFARPILERLRRAVHKGCPRCAETMKWGTPHFEHRGLLAGMAAFKAHVSFSFWKGKLLDDPERLFADVGRTQMCALKVGTLGELPTQKVLVDYVRRAARLNEDGVKLPIAQRGTIRVTVPEDLAAALARDRKAKATFEAFAPSHRREYVQWITEAKRAETRERRIRTAVAWLAEGKPRNWKYQA